jgi:hypothetical protein
MEQPKNLNQFILAWVIIAGFIATMIYLLHLVHSGAVIADQTGAVFMMLGSISNMAAAVVMYFFGSTKGSADKTAQLVELAKTGDFSKPPCPPEVNDATSIKP